MLSSSQPPFCNQYKQFTSGAIPWRGLSLSRLCPFCISCQGKELEAVELQGDSSNCEITVGMITVERNMGRKGEMENESEGGGF